MASVLQNILPSLIPSLLNDWWVPASYHIACTSIILHAVNTFVTEWSEQTVILSTLAVIVVTLVCHAIGVRTQTATPESADQAKEAVSPAPVPALWWWHGSGVQVTSLEDVLIALFALPECRYSIFDRRHLHIESQWNVVTADKSEKREMLSWTPIRVPHYDIPAVEVYCGHIYFSESHFFASDESLRLLREVAEAYPQCQTPHRILTKWDLSSEVAEFDSSSIYGLCTVGRHNHLWDGSNSTFTSNWFQHMLLGNNEFVTERLQYYDEQCRLIRKHLDARWIQDGIYPIRRRKDGRLDGWWIQTSTPRQPNERSSSATDEDSDEEDDKKSEPPISMATYKCILRTDAAMLLPDPEPPKPLETFQHYHSVYFDLTSETTGILHIGSTMTTEQFLALIAPHSLPSLLEDSLRGIIPFNDHVWMRCVSTSFNLNAWRFHPGRWAEQCNYYLVFMSNTKAAIEQVKQQCNGTKRIQRDDAILLDRYHLSYIERSDEQKELLANSSTGDVSALLSAYKNIKRTNKWVYQCQLLRNRENPIMASFDSVISPHIPRLREIQSMFHSHEAYVAKHMRWFCGILLYGPPGCGKSMLQLAIANEFNRHMVTVSSNQLIVPQDVYDLLNEEILDIPRNGCKDDTMSVHVPTLRRIIVMDEIDRAFTTECRNHMIGALLSEIDGLNNIGGRMIIATTNHFDRIPKELYRPGRLMPLPCTLLTPELALTHLQRWFARDEVLTYEDTIEGLIHDERRAPSPVMLKEWVFLHPNDLSAVMQEWRAMMPLTQAEFDYGFHPELPCPYAN